jgi:polyisoprenoid-binding protein YceI
MDPGQKGCESMMSRYLILLFLYLWPLGAIAQKNETVWTLGENSFAVLNGDSSIRKWRIATDVVHGSIHLPFSKEQVAHFVRWTREHPEAASSRIEKEFKNTPPKIQATLKIKINELKSGNTHMEKDMQEALKAKEYPWIVFTLSDVNKVSVQPREDESVGIILHTTGLLQLAGAEKIVRLDFKLTPTLEKGVLLVSDSEFLMTSFDITPPRGLFGLIKARDKVDIHYEIQLVEEEPPPSE